MERTENDHEWNGGKFPNRARKGLALSEFLDGADGESTSPDELQPSVRRDQDGRLVENEPRSLGGMTMLLMPLAGLVAGVLAAVGLVAFLRPRRRQAQAPYDEYGTRRVRPLSDDRPGRYLQRL